MNNKSAIMIKFLIIVGIVFGFQLITFNHSTGKVRCKDFKTYTEAQKSYKAGAYWLDGDGDGKACDKLNN